MAGALRHPGHGRHRGVQLLAAGHRRRARHHQRAGTDQRRRAGLLAAGDRAARDLSDRDRHGGPAGPAADALAVALRPVPGDRHFRGRHRHLFRPPAGQPASAGGQGKPARRHHAHHGADLLRAGRDLPVDGGGGRRRAQARRHALHPHGPARDPGLGHQAAAAQHCRRHRDQRHRRLRQGVPGRAQHRKARLLRPGADRHHDRAGPQQRQHRGRLHRTQGRAVPDPRAGPGALDAGHRRRGARDRAGPGHPHPRRGRGIHRARTAHRGGHQQRRGSGWARSSC